MNNDPDSQNKDSPATRLLREARFEKLVASVQHYALFMLDPTGHVVTWNDGAKQIKGYTADEIIGSHFSQFYPADRIQAGWPDHGSDARQRLCCEFKTMAAELRTLILSAFSTYLLRSTPQMRSSAVDWVSASR
ncbi:MAG: PAS domain S-box protein [Gammaproteobacteria bacterium]